MAEAHAAAADLQQQVPQAMVRMGVVDLQKHAEGESGQQCSQVMVYEDSMGSACAGPHERATCRCR